MSDTPSSAPSATPSASTPSTDGKTAPTSSETPKDVQASAAEKRRLKLKIDGQEREVDTDEIERDYSRYHSADKKFQEAATTKKQINEFLNGLKANPTQGLRELSKRLGFDLTAVSNEVLRGNLEDEMLSPADKENRAKDERLKKFEDQEKEQLTKKEQGEREERIEQSRVKIAGIIEEAMESAKYLSKDGTAVEDMARYMIHCQKNGIEYDAQDVARHVEKRAINQFTNVIKNMEVPDILRNMPGLVEKVRAHYLAEMKAKRGSDAGSISTSQSYSREDKPTERISPAQMKRLSRGQ
jgi:hypothetical protein